MEWHWLVIVAAILFLLFVLYRLSYIKGYRDGAKRVLAEWKQTLLEEDDFDDETH